MTTATTRKISISVDGIWAGDGDLRDGVIENCDAEFFDNHNLSDSIYERIEYGIQTGKSRLVVELDGDEFEVSWTITEPS